MSCSQLAILKLMKNSDEPWQDLLELICERIPPKQNTESLHMRCSSHLEGHWVNVEGLVLLDEVERSFGSTVLKIEMIYSDNGYCLVISPQWYAVS